MGWFSRGFDRKVAQGLEQLRAESKAQAAAPAAAEEGAAPPQDLADVPACVRRYLERASAANSKCLLVSAKQVGQFKPTPQSSWQPMSATQTASPLTPALIWTARCRLKPLMGMLGYDARLGGKGTIDWRLWGWLPAVTASGGELDRTMLVRWLAEAPGFPSAMLPSAQLRWEAAPGAENEAKAIITHGGATASGIFAFDEAGLVSSFRSSDYERPGSGGKDGKKPWVVRYRSHAQLTVAPPSSKSKGDGKEAAAADVPGSLFVPVEAEALWVEADGRETPYVRFKLEGLTAE